jgi:hypothetical protein
MQHNVLRGFDLEARISGTGAVAVMRGGGLQCSPPWLDAAQNLVDEGTWFERSGRRFAATLDGDPMSVFMTLLRCPIELVSASLDVART